MDRREINRLVAEKVMGWHQEALIHGQIICPPPEGAWTFWADADRECRAAVDSWNPTDDAWCALQVLGHEENMTLKNEGKQWHVGWLGIASDDGADGDYDTLDWEDDVTHSEVGIAICLSALKRHNVKVSE